LVQTARKHYLTKLCHWVKKKLINCMKTEFHTNTLSPKPWEITRQGKWLEDKRMVSNNGELANDYLWRTGLKKRRCVGYNRSHCRELLVLLG
jgi:hypothetical protein